ncbi:GNAT family N-acetyltransferase [Fusobacterium varium]|jgi:ribosomal protein S18 acetylase RimI-like enzyme|uniref:GNAT family N-acetyltransferase n=1 Tax=Fusobacterium varium TaxID=856 RepID=UPI000E428D6D|nr:GNAT family N-acetyltransferase [Fusobacterium varium]MCI6033252.1 GNAT family N-acetyltransferase [Fusobacterium varium]MDY4006726.1 GNAT family N-acetyltransferase [Fusobacterium varium]RGJ28101.1 N-acetyltransferase [Fusobacterium varium]
MEIDIKAAYNDLENIKLLFNEYTTMLGVNLTFQGYDEEIKNLPGKYALPYGRLYIAYYDNKAAGCIALRKFENDGCEMKRLFVRPEYRHLKIGKKLVDKIIEDARELKYKYMVLDTLSNLHEAVSLYRKSGFQEVEAYYENPLDNVLYFKLEL